MSTSSTPTVKLNTGAFIPLVGLGTWQSPKGEVEHAVEHALKKGYRHIDAAFCYQNEQEVGQGIKKSGVSRSEIFVTSKLWSTYHSRPAEGLEITLRDLGLDYVDLYLMHWPVALNPKGSHPLFPRKEDGTRDHEQGWDYVKTWKEMEKLVETGKVKAIGVSNFSTAYLDELLKTANVVPAANQVECHPLLPQTKLAAYCADKGIVLEAYSPLGSTGSPLMKEQAVKKLADKYGVEPGTILISYLVARGIPALPKSVTPSRIEQNLRVVDLSPDEVDELSTFAKREGKNQRFVAPDWGVDLKWKEDEE